MILAEQTVFPALIFDAKDGWDRLPEITHGFLDERGLRRLVPVLEGKCASVIIEREYIDKDYRDTFANFHSKRFTTPPSRCVRLHFFEHPVTAAQLDDPSLLELENRYLGYSVIRATRPNSVGRTFLSDCLRQNANSHLCRCEDHVQILGEKFTVKGFPFISQDGDATVCAESSLWMILRYLSNRYKNYAETLPFQITKLAGNHALGQRVFPSAGLYSWQLAEALRLRDVAPLIYSREQYKDRFEHLLYTYIESGFPLLTTVDSHVFVSFGHASDFSLVGGSAVPFRYTSEFNESLTICDDNFFPYQELRRHGGGGDRNRSRFCFADINEFIVPLPEKVFLPAEAAQEAIENVLNDSEIGIGRLSPSLKAEDLTLRLFLTTNRALKSKLRLRGMGHPAVAKIYRQIPLPHFIWVCEISVASEYSSRLEIRGEILWDATRNAYEPDGWLALHYPEILIVDLGSVMNRPQDLKTFPLQNSEAYPLFQSNLNPIATV